MRLAILLISLLNGGYMLLDGLYVMFKGKYIGPPVPGPWAGLFTRLGLDVFKLGPLFVVFGIAWLVLAYGIYMEQPWAHVAGLILSVCTLWYLPLGTLFSIVVFSMLWWVK